MQQKNYDLERENVGMKNKIIQIIGGIDKYNTTPTNDSYKPEESYKILQQETKRYEKLLLSNDKLKSGLIKFI